MSGPIDEQPSASRGLADILREAGVTSAGSGGRRRRREGDRDEEATAPPDEPTYDFENVHAADLFGTSQRSDFFDAAQTPSPEGPTGTDTDTDRSALSSYLLANSRSETETEPAVEDAGAAATPPPRTDTGPLPARGWAATVTTRTSSPAAPAGGVSTSTLRPSTSPASPERESAGSGGSHANRSIADPSAGVSHANRSASPVATTDADDIDDEDSALPLRGGVTGWAVLAVELLAALGLGVAAWYAFSALWELLPYVAAFAGPLVVTGLVAVAGALRSRTGRNPLGLPTLCMLVFAGTVLVVLPAATVIVP